MTIETAKLVAKMAKALKNLPPERLAEVIAAYIEAFDCESGPVLGNKVLKEMRLERWVWQG